MDEYPQDGSSFYTPKMPEETKQQLLDERSKSSIASPFIEEVSEWFDEQIKQFDSVSLALYEAEARGVTIEEILNALNICKDKFSEKKDEFMSLQMNLKK
jgi:hypothetical protein